MSSTPASSSAIPSSVSRVQSANNNKSNEESSKDLNNATSIIEKSSRPSSAQNILSTVAANERPPSASKQSVESTTIGSRPGSAAKISSQDTINRPSSAVKSDPTLTSNSDTPLTVQTTSRPTSANVKQVETMSNPINIIPTNSRPSSANKKSDDATITNVTTGITGSRPPSASNKSDDTITIDNITTTTTGSRPSSANRKQDDTTTNNCFITLSSSRPSSSSNRKQEETTINHTDTIKQHDTSTTIDLNDPNITQPIIGRPSSSATAKKVSNEGPTTIANLISAVPLNPSSINTSSSSDNNKSN
ncbi:unnamed protein product [Adineta steineri]|uniref:Uncharacterized protein n=1 Tax=Adineta steineri TaxID=433720 RepID=A0A814HGD4_9BILA|nr:unnamed protein product [Adineta steineri]CAF1568110.1 unnamed protein product [Adineta steineri]